MQLRSICKHGGDYLEAIKALKGKCLKSWFCKALVDDMIKITAEGKIGLDFQWRRQEKSTKM